MEITVEAIINPKKVYCKNCKWKGFSDNWSWCEYPEGNKVGNNFTGGSKPKVPAIYKWDVNRNADGDCSFFKEKQGFLKTLLNITKDRRLEKKSHANPV